MNALNDAINRAIDLRIELEKTETALAAERTAREQAELEQAKAEIAVEAEARETLEKWYTSARDDAKAELALHREALKVLAEWYRAHADPCQIPATDEGCMGHIGVAGCHECTTAAALAEAAKRLAGKEQP